MKSNTAQLAEAKKYLGDGCRTCCHMANNCCSYFVSMIFRESGNKSLFYGGRTVTYVPTAETWMRANLAQIPIYMAMPSDVITFDWNKNGTSDHIGFVANRVSDNEIHTLEGNTGVGIVAYRNRPDTYISGVWRPHFKPTSFTTLKKLVIDGQFDYNSIACLQLALRRGGYYKGKINGILDKDTVKALQKKASDGSGIRLAQDGAWGAKTTRALQKWLNIKVDGHWGVKSTMSLQRWINNYNDWYAKKHNLKPQEDPNPKPKPQPRTIFDDANEWAEKLCESENGKYRVFTDDPLTQICPICHPKAKKGMNCIQAAMAYLRHGAGIPCRCNAEVINDTMMDRLLRSDHKTAVELVQECMGLKDFTVVSAGDGKPIPTSKLQKGDVIIYYDGEKSAHMGVHIGGGKLFDCARGHSPQMQCGKLDVEWWKRTNDWDVKIAIRYTGKLVK